MTFETIAQKKRPVRILLVEDNRGDAILTKRAFQKAMLPSQITVVSTGEDAIAMLYKDKSTVADLLPDLILLDLNLPRLNGQEVLKTIKEHDKLRHIPVVVLSSSRAKFDVVKSYNLHANGYVVKPASAERFQDMVKYLEQFWFTLVIMPDVEDFKEVQGL
ncbi:MAG: response regulator [Proteobacteria bacterium]|nr:response regulator [Pseudomonadota bacterium]